MLNCLNFKLSKEEQKRIEEILEKMKKSPETKEKEKIRRIAEINRLVGEADHYLIQYQRTKRLLVKEKLEFQQMFGEVELKSAIMPEMPFTEFPLEKEKYTGGLSLADAAYLFINDNHISRISVKELWDELAIRGLRSKHSNPKIPLASALMNDTKRFSRVKELKNTFEIIEID